MGLKGFANFFLLLLAASPLQAAIGPDQLARLDSDLTPVGAERAGSADGRIPPWTGGLPPTPINPDEGYVDPYAQDPVLYTVTAENAAQYASQLSDGHRAMLAAHPDTLRMHVYPTRRSASWPKAVLDQVRIQAPLARTDGYQLLDVGSTSVPFPFTRDPLQMMWNHSMRWRGGSVVREYSWFPVSTSGRYFKVTVLDVMAFNQPGYIDKIQPNRLLNLYGLYLAPASLEGQITLVQEPVNPVTHSRHTWSYAPGPRRVLRIPSLEYDDMDRRTQGLRTTDQYDGWNGAPDLYDWKLLGRREVLIPYNSFRLSSKKLKYADILKPGHPDSELLRFELHRVWVVEATLRPDKDHRFQRRVFYLDEDTWQVSLEEAYDHDNRLWRFGEHHAMQFYDVQVPWYRATVFYDLRSGAYLASDLDNESKQSRVWGKKFQSNAFLPGNLRRLGNR